MGEHEIGLAGSDHVEAVAARNPITVRDPAFGTQAVGVGAAVPQCGNGLGRDGKATYGHVVLLN